MKREYIIVVIIGLVVFEYILDRVAGPILAPLKNPFEFLAPEILYTYPLTAVSIGAKTLAIVLAVPLALSLIGRFYLTKALSTFVLGGLFELYAIQQLATGLRITPIEWTLSFAYAGIALLIPVTGYLLLGLFTGAKRVSKKIYETANNEEEMKL